MHARLHLAPVFRRDFVIGFCNSNLFYYSSARASKRMSEESGRNYSRARRCGKRKRNYDPKKRLFSHDDYRCENLSQYGWPPIQSDCPSRPVILRIGPLSHNYDNAARSNARRKHMHDTIMTQLCKERNQRKRECRNLLKFPCGKSMSVFLPMFPGCKKKSILEQISLLLTISLQY